MSNRTAPSHRSRCVVCWRQRPLARASWWRRASGGRNSALVGNDVATRLDGAAVLISNPAGIVERSAATRASAFFTIFF